MTLLSSLLTWANVPFVVALGVAVTFAVLQVSGLLGLLAGGGDHDGDADHDADAGGDHEADVDADGDADVDADGDADADADGDADVDGDADHDADHDAHGHGSPAASAGAGHMILAGMGVGTMPLSIVWQSFAVCFALGGITSNTAYLSTAGALPTSALVVSVPVALAFAYAATRLVSRVFGRLAPAPGKTSTSRKDLVGKTGIVISSRVTAEFGEVRLTDASGIVHRIICRVLQGEEPIAEGREVVIVEYERERDVLYVAPFEIDAPPRRRRVRGGADSKTSGERGAGPAPGRAGEADDADDAGEAAGEPRSKMTS